MNVQKKWTPSGIFLLVISFLFAAIMLLPLAWALAVSLQHEGKQIVTIWDWFLGPYTLENYPALIFGSNTLRWFKNSLLVAVIATVLTILCSTLAAYALAKIPFKGSKGFYLYFLLGMLVPGEATIVPLFILVNNLGLIDTYAGLLLPGIAGAMNLIITMNFFKGLPDALLEAVRIDGGSELTIYFKIALPLSKPIISTVGIMTFIGSWNNYLWPLLCLYDDKMFTLPIGIPTLMSIQRPDYVVPMTANLIASLPMIFIYLLFEKQIVQGVAMDGIKG